MLRQSLFAAVAAIVVAAPVAAAPFDAAIAGPQRSEANKARDQYRHPAETLAFFGIKPGQTVVEISPSGGWYTEILAPGLGSKGTLYAAHNDPAASERAAAGVAKFKAKLAADPAYANVKVTAFGKGAYDIAPAGSADAVVSFRNVHNWYMAGGTPEAFKAFFTALKKGGTLGIVEHRMAETTPDAAMKDSGYMKTSYVRKMAEAAGFKYVGSSEINANPKDTKDYPKGVWTLPPNFAEGEATKAKYAAIGESDRMTLKFVKP
ncbi:methyltransferase [Polymorphobacter glacialis]|uniref:Methyltransferase n=1 Tax=Sandarakinorhabdus glacialis TaxID=1614636 RepID=A0A917A0E2_9SPHN|nr:class I SAM-dependent methyltransferase [Polymorphobacter glacialis]GGE21135.1 methyltransferase [Polymorphobacter glacialis]